MKAMYRTTGLILLLMLISVGVWSAPPTMNIQGSLTDATNQPVADGDYSITFRIYNAESGGNEVWSETIADVSVTDGIFSVLLGSTNPLGASVFVEDDRWLGIQLEGESEMAPRSPLVSVPWSARSAWADTAEYAVSNGDTHWSETPEGIGYDAGVARITGPAHLEVTGAGLDSNGEFISARLGNAFDHWTYFGDGNSGRIRGSDEGYLFLSSNPRGSGDKSVYVDASGHSIHLNAPGVIQHGADFVMQAGGERGDGGRALVHWLNDELVLNFEGDFVGGTHVHGNFNVDLRGRSGSAGRDAIHIRASDDNNAGTIVVNKPTLWFYSSSEGKNALLSCGGVYSEGRVQCSSLEIMGGADLAEPFPFSGLEKPTAGAVAIIDEGNPGHLKLTDKPYDSRVAGVISGAGGVNPGLTLSQTSELGDGHNVALAGRVYALASTVNGAIKPGDLLTTSPIRGHVMKATDPTKALGAIVGKAMTGLKDDEGLVLVLVQPH